MRAQFVVNAKLIFCIQIYENISEKPSMKIYFSDLTKKPFFNFSCYIYRNMSKEEVQLIVVVTKKFRKDYKLLCLNADQTMSDRIRNLMELDLAGRIVETEGK